MSWSIILYALLAWFLYNLIFRFIIPVYRTGKKMKQQFRKMQETMQEQVNRQQPGAQSSQARQPKASSNPKVGGDYIDFEEIK